VALAFGYSPEDVDLLAAQGFTADELEDLFYSGEI
jgi:glucosamine--fructose-6-phosphate aminotransferase (isomerizing)